MFETRHSNILNETEGILVHSVNAQGVMGAGLALAIRKKYPQVYKDYMDVFMTSTPNSLLGTTIFTEITPAFIIASGIGQLNYGRVPGTRYTDYGAIKAIFATVNRVALMKKLPVIFPKLGCGLGGGKWEIIEKIIEEELDKSIVKTFFNL